MKSLQIQIGLRVVQLKFPKESTLTASDISVVKGMLGQRILEGSFLMYCKQACTYKISKNHKPIHMDLFKEKPHGK